MSSNADKHIKSGVEKTTENVSEAVHSTKLAANDAAH